jgi:Leucine-rich repeat (LRR) protein
MALENLRYLNLNRNRIQNASVLRAMPSLGQVYLYNNPINRLGCPTNPNTLCLM